MCIHLALFVMVGIRYWSATSRACLRGEGGDDGSVGCVERKGKREKGARKKESNVRVCICVDQ